MLIKILFPREMKYIFQMIPFIPLQKHYKIKKKSIDMIVVANVRGHEFEYTEVCYPLIYELERDYG